MINILNYIAENKTWIFSGIGVAIISAILGLLFRKNKSSNNKSLRSGDSSTNIQTGDGSSVSIKNILPNEEKSKSNIHLASFKDVKMYDPKYKRLHEKAVEHISPSSCQLPKKSKTRVHFGLTGAILFLGFVVFKLILWLISLF